MFGRSLKGPKAGRCPGSTVRVRVLQKLMKVGKRFCTIANYSQRLVWLVDAMQAQFLHVVKVRRGYATAVTISQKFMKTVRGSASIVSSLQRLVKSVRGFAGAVSIRKCSLMMIEVLQVQLASWKRLMKAEIGATSAVTVP